MTYDTRDRILTKAPDPSRGEATHIYTYWPNGLRKTAANASGTTTYTYDVRDRVAHEGHDRRYADVHL